MKALRWINGRVKRNIDNSDTLIKPIILVIILIKVYSEAVILVIFIVIVTNSSLTERVGTGPACRAVVCKSIPELTILITCPLRWDLLIGLAF